MNKLTKYWVIAAATLGAPVISDISGYSSYVAKNSIEDTRQHLVTLKKSNPTDYCSRPEFIDRNLRYIDSNRKTMESVSRTGLDIMAGLIGLSASVLAMKKR
jgi:hypothetical protein